MPDTRVFTVRRFIESSNDFFGVEPYVAKGAFYGSDPAATMTVDAAKAVVDAWLGTTSPGPSPTPPAPPAPTGNWLPPVATFGALPNVGNGRGDVRLALDTFTLYAWNPDTAHWVGLGGGGGGGGGGPSIVPNLFVQQVQPDPAGLLLDSLWVATNPDGTAKDPSAWRVYTGTGSGAGGNLFVQATAPVPDVDALWVPTNVDGTAKYLDEWVVFTGRGSLPGVGNPNLFIQPTLPSAPAAGSLYIPLNPNETPKTIDQWRVYA